MHGFLKFGLRVKHNPDFKNLEVPGGHLSMTELVGLVKCYDQLTNEYHELSIIDTNKASSACLGECGDQREYQKWNHL